jgi:hypothetical protein
MPSLYKEQFSSSVSQFLVGNSHGKLVVEVDL